MWEQKGRGDAADAADEDEHGRERRYEQYNQHKGGRDLAPETAGATDAAAHSPKPPPKTRALVFTDAGADLDDEMALLLAKALIDADQLSLEAVVYYITKRSARSW